MFIHNDSDLVGMSLGYRFADFIKVVGHSFETTTNTRTPSLLGHVSMEETCEVRPLTSPIGDPMLV